MPHHYPRSRGLVPALSVWMQPNERQSRLPQKEAMLPNEDMPDWLSRLLKQLNLALSLSSRTEELLDVVASDLRELQASRGRSIPALQNSAQIANPMAAPRRTGRFSRESPR